MEEYYDFNGIFVVLEGRYGSAFISEYMTEFYENWESKTFDDKVKGLIKILQGVALKEKKDPRKVTREKVLGLLEKVRLEKVI